MKNSTNNTAKRTATQVTAILNANGLNLKAENLGDGRSFCVADNSIKTRVIVKKAGFILSRSTATDKVLSFKTW